MDITLLIIITSAGLIIGLLIGLMINTVRSESSKQTARSAQTSNSDSILLKHDRSSGNLIVEIDGAMFAEPGHMRTDQRARLATAYDQLKRFLGVRGSSTQPPANKREPSITAQKDQKLSSSIPDNNTVEPIPVKLGGTKKPATEIVKPISIVAEIDEILQTMITGTPYAERGLKIFETPSHSISVWIDKKQYQSIDEVPDKKVQEMIHGAVKTWEDKIS